MPARVVGVLVLVLGVILVVYGINAADSVSFEVNEALTGTPTDRAMWFLIGGGILAVLGLSVLARGGRAERLV